MILSWLFPLSAPLDKETQHWIEVRTAWIIKEFGLERLRAKPIILSDDPRLPEEWHGSKEEVDHLFSVVCEIMDVSPELVELRWFTNEEEAAGLFEQGKESSVVWLNALNLNDPKRLLATMAHELSHFLLLTSGRISSDVPDHELVTDLLPVFFGLGVFMADGTVRSGTHRHGTEARWSVSRQGYLAARHYGFAIALWVNIREENEYPFASHLRPDAGETFWATLKYLKKKKFDSFRFLQYTNAGEKLDIPQSIRELEELAPDEEPEEKPVAGHSCGSCGGGHSSCHQPPADGAGEPHADPPSDANLIIDDPFTVGSIAMHQGEFEHAIQYFTMAVDEDPEDAEALEHRSGAYLAAGNAADAFRDADRAVEIEPSEVTYKARGLAAMKLEHYEAAYDDFNEALGYLSAWDTNEAMLSELYYLRGLASFRLGDIDSGLADVSRAIRRDPGQVEYYQTRAEIHEHRGDYDRAEQDRELADRFKPVEEPE